MATSASVYNYQRTVRQILKRHRKEPASFVVHIHPQFMRFERQDGCFLFESRTKVRISLPLTPGLSALPPRPETTGGPAGRV